MLNLKLTKQMMLNFLQKMYMLSGTISRLETPKALLSTNLPDGMYYEVTYNANRDEIYFDAYKKWTNCCISLEEIKKKNN